MPAARTGPWHAGTRRRSRFRAPSDAPALISYVFGAGLATNAAVTISPGYCIGVVTIVRT